MGILEWAAIFDTVGGLVKVARRVGQGAVEGLAGTQGVPDGSGHAEARLAGVVVAALKEAFDRDSVRLEMEQARIDAERRRADELLHAELRRQAADRMLQQLRLIAVMAVATWALSAVLGVWMPGMREGLPKIFLGAGWLFAFGALGSAFAGWQRVSMRSADASGAAAVLAHPATMFAPWLLIIAMALTGAGLLTAL